MTSMDNVEPIELYTRGMLRTVNAKRLKTLMDLGGMRGLLLGNFTANNPTIAMRKTLATEEALAIRTDTTALVISSPRFAPS